MQCSHLSYASGYAAINFYKIYTAYLVPLCVLIPVLVFFSKYRFAPVKYKTIFWYLITSASINFAGIIIAFKHQSNLWLFHVDTITESILLLFFFQKINYRTPVKVAIQMILLLFPLACVLNLLFFQKGIEFNTYPRVIESMLFIFLAAIYWLQENNEAENIAWSKNPLNWILSGIILYFASSFSLFVFSNFLLADAISRHDFYLLRIVWSVHATLLLIMYLLFSVGFYKIEKQ